MEINHVSESAFRLMQIHNTGAYSIIHQKNALKYVRKKVLLVAGVVDLPVLGQLERQILTLPHPDS